MDWQLIESDEALHTLLARARGCDAVMVDTEFMRRNTFYPQVALVQLCFRGGDAAGTAWLVDPLALADPAPLAALLADEAVVKVLHSPGEDLEVFQRWLGVLPTPMFDTQKAAAMVGMDFSLGYQALVRLLCEQELEKGETRSDWLQRPLTESQCHYAAQDVSWLLAAFNELERRCRDQERYDWVLEDGRDATSRAPESPGDAYRRVKGASRLSRAQLAVLRAVCEWRELRAREVDKPRSWIIDDKACLALAQAQPKSRGELSARVDLPPAVLRKQGDRLLDLVAGQSGLPEEALPEPLPPPLDNAEKRALKTLKSRAGAIAEELGMAPQLLLASKDYELLLRGGDEPAYWQGWRRERVIARLREGLAGGGA